MAAPDLVFADAALAKTYQTYRPQPPPSIVARILSFWNKGKDSREVTQESPAQKPGSLLVDVGCGSGQSTHMFVNDFDQVVGVDVSPDQLMVARQNYSHIQNISFIEGNALHLPFPPASVDVVTVCAAVHWFNLDAFYAQVDQVLRPGGVLAVYSYLSAYPLYQGKCLRHVMDELWKALEFWPPEHRQLATEYALMPAPYQEEEHVSSSDGELEVSSVCRLSDLLGYISSWSALAKLRTKRGPDAAQQYLDDAKAKLLKEMGCTEEDPEIVKRHRYFLRMWRKPQL